MKSYLLLLVIPLLLIIACSKKNEGCTSVDPDDEAQQILNYANDNGINAVKHSSGIFYQIIDSGAGVTPVLNSRVFVTYSGRLLNGTLFDEKVNPIDFVLSEVIEGWQSGIPLIKKGGFIKLLIPSSYAYGCNGNGSIPPNSILYFEVHLIDVQ